MLSNSHLYSSWRKELAQVVGDKYQKYRLTNLVLLVVGIFQARSVHLSVIARKIPIRAQKLSLMKRLARFLANPVFRVRAWYRPVAERLVQAAGSAGQIHLGLDATKVSAHHRLLMVAIAYRGRTLPLAWTWVRSSKGHSTATKQLALLRYVRTLIPASMKVSVVGDSEFASTRLMRQFD